MFESVILESSIIEVSELNSHPDYLQVKFVISDFDTNKNKVKLNRDTIEEWMSTLIGSPLLGKITKNFNKKEDFSSHEMKIISFKDEDGKKHRKAVFDTSAFGVFTDVAIEEIDNVECIVATARVWKRFENACKIIQDRAENLKSSWEIATEKYTMVKENGSPVKIIDLGRFIGHCCLGSSVPPAYDRTAVLDVASEQEDELNIALMEDLENLNISSNINTEDKEVNMRLDNKEIVETSEVAENSTEQENTTVTEETSEVVDPVDKSAKDKDKESDNKEKDDKDTDDTEKTDDEDEEKEKSESKDNDGNKENDDEDEKEKSDITETSALTDSDLRHHLEKAFEQKNEDGHCTYGWIFMIFPADNTAWFRECGKCSDTELVEVKYTVENNNVTITERNNVVLTVSPREINQTIAQKDSAIAEMSSQIKSLTDEVSALKPYKDKVEEIEKAEKEAQLEQDRKELSEYAISSGYITAEEVETSEEIKSMINDLNKVGIQSIISDRVVSQLNNKKTTNVEISEDNSEKQNNISVNLSAIDVSVSAKNGKNISTKDATDAVRRYIGRR